MLSGKGRKATVMTTLQTEKQPRRPVTWGQRGVVVTLLFLAAAAVFYAGEWAARRETERQIDAIRRTLELQVLALRGKVAQYTNIPYTAAQHLDVQLLLQRPSQDVQLRVNRYLQEVSRRIGSEALYLMDEHGLTLAASNWNTKGSFVGDNYGFRPYYLDAIAGRNGFFYAVGATTGKPGLFMSTPVRVAGKPVGVVAIKVSLQEVEESWRIAGTPAFLTDERGIVFLSSMNSWAYKTTRNLSSAELAWVLDHAQYGDKARLALVPWDVKHIRDDPDFVVTTAVDDTPREFLTLSEALPEFGWTLGAMSDFSSVRRARWVGASMALLAVTALTLAGLYWRQRERRFREQRALRRELEVRVRERTAELQDAHAFRKAMGDSLLVGMRARDLEGRIIYINPAFSDITGYGPEELLGRLPPYPYWHPDNMEKHWLENEAALTGRAELTGFESRIRHRDGRDVYTMVYTAPLIDALGVHTGWMSSVVDITAQKAAEELARVQADGMQRTSRLASMGEMASTLAHELNQPLMALVNYSGAASAFSERGHKDLLHETLQEIRAQTQRAAEIVSRIRGFVKQHTPGFDNCGVNELVTNMLALLRPEIRHQKMRVMTRLAEGLPVIKADRVLLEQVVLNLVINAMQAMQDRVPVDKVIHIDTGLENSMIFVRVSDNGPGISLEVAANLFQPFFTTKPEGLGLGLNICRTTVEAHRGRLEFENRPTGGAAFTVYLPLST
jgi:two-component system, LuxR family, sensor histidine kinase DctS